MGEVKTHIFEKNTFMLIEIAVFNPESAFLAASAGAQRIELCSAPSEGGLTPSEGILRLVRNRIDIPIHVIIRPRGGDFCYSSREFESMLLDIESVKKAGADGIVTGILKPDGSVDIRRTAMLVKVAYPMNTTFHRAFDRTANPMEALDEVIETGSARILTSGAQERVSEGALMIRDLVAKAGDRITIMPGSGLNSGNFTQIAEITGATEFHLSARKSVSGAMRFRPKHIFGGENSTEYQVLHPDETEIEKMLRLSRDILQNRS
jgi:copper homeostasis protein